MHGFRSLQEKKKKFKFVSISKFLLLVNSKLIKLEKLSLSWKSKFSRTTVPRKNRVGELKTNLNCRIPEGKASTVIIQRHGTFRFRDPVSKLERKGEEKLEGWTRRGTEKEILLSQRFSTGSVNRGILLLNFFLYSWTNERDWKKWHEDKNILVKKLNCVKLRNRI